MATKKGKPDKLLRKPRRLPKLVALELVPVDGGWRVVTRVKIPGKGGAPRKTTYDRVFGSLAKARRTAEQLRRASHAACEITVKE